ncbi:hypothetical protein [Pantoea dispersa]|uniref:hypothetical protein n=1 Tax=Pantoea dispersa TaxID=59814 RepID=UPI001F0C97EF|nr:hypothetical protein [Pantoea dispersa]
MPTKRKSRKSQTNQVELYQQVTDKIVASFEREVYPGVNHGETASVSLNHQYHPMH